LPLNFPESTDELPQFWQSGFNDFNVYSPRKMKQKLDYLHANPVTCGLVKPKPRTSHPRASSGPLAPRACSDKMSFRAERRICCWFFRACPFRPQFHPKDWPSSSFLFYVVENRVCVAARFYRQGTISVVP
jgi:hypothetical protein